MTVHDIIKLALANEYEDIENDPDAKRFSIDVINMLLADAYEAEQYYREMHKLNALTAIPSVSQLTDAVPYNEGLTRIAFVFWYPYQGKYYSLEYADLLNANSIRNVKLTNFTRIFTAADSSSFPAWLESGGSGN